MDRYLVGRHGVLHCVVDFVRNMGICVVELVDYRVGSMLL